MEASKHANIITSDLGLVPISQQELESLMGVERRIMCAPAALLTAARQAAYSIHPSKIMNWINWSHWHDSSGWSRPGLTGTLREQCDVSIVSWWSKSTGQQFKEGDIEQMRRSGYVNTSLEGDFLKNVVEQVPQGTNGIVALLEKGCPITVTVKPGFGANKVEHAIVLQGYNSEDMTVSFYDPDERNAESICSEDYFKQYLSAAGACTVVLPAHS